MRRLVSCAEASRLDRETQEGAALPAIVLMEDAAVGLWEALRPIAARLGAGAGGGPLVAACGAGNNAGDALAVLRRARFEGLPGLAAVLGRDELGEPASTYLGSLRASGLPLLSWERDRAACVELLGRAALVLDGIAGTGLSGPLRGGLGELAEALNAAGRPVASIDLPSGLRDGFRPGDILVEAGWTASVEPRKAALYAPAQRPACGEILGIEGVFPAGSGGSAAALLGEEDLASLAPPDRPDRHKGERGRAAVFAGSLGSSGAASLASRAALAAGAGLATLFVSPELVPALSARLEAVMVAAEPAESAPPGAWQALLAGPGWGRGPDRRESLARLLALGLPTVLDADALRLLAELRASGGWLARPSAPLVLTPHPGEFEALSGIGSAESLADPAAALLPLAAETGAVIVLKSQVTWIAAPDGRLAVWEGRESGLATAGSGDVLAGLTAGFLAALWAAGEPDAAFRAARAAVVVHGLAGRRARRYRGWFEAGALVDEAALVAGAPR